MASRRPSRTLFWLAAVGAMLAVAELIRIAGLNYYYEALDFTRAPLSGALAEPASLGLPRLEAVEFSGAAGERISGWLVPPTNGAVVMVLHGANADRGSMSAEIQALARSGLGVFAFDWPGQGKSGGNVDWGAGARATMGAALDWLVRQPGVAPDRIGALGFSMGGLVLVPAAANQSRLRALALVATPTAMEDPLKSLHGPLAVFRRWPALWRLRRSWVDDPPDEPVAAIARLAGRPLLIVGSRTDQVVPGAMAQVLFDTAREPKQLLMLPKGRHGLYAEDNGERYTGALANFFSVSLASGPNRH